MSFDLKLEQGDLQLSTESDLNTVENGDKLTQDILKIVTTQIGSSPLHPWYGCPITQSLIGRAFDEVFVDTAATNQLRFSLSNLEKLQKEQMRTDQLVTAQEHIGAIQNVAVRRNPIDPRFFTVEVAVISKAFRRVFTDFTVTL